MREPDTRRTARGLNLLGAFALGLAAAATAALWRAADPRWLAVVPPAATLLGVGLLLVAARFERNGGALRRSGPASATASGMAIALAHAFGLAALPTAYGFELLSAALATLPAAPILAFGLWLAACAGRGGPIVGGLLGLAANAAATPVTAVSLALAGAAPTAAVDAATYLHGGAYGVAAGVGALAALFLDGLVGRAARCAGPASERFDTPLEA